MKDAKFTVKGMVEFFKGKESVIASFPETIDELRRMKSIKVTADNGEVADYPIEGEKWIAYARRGFGLSFQSGGGETLSEEEKEVRKTARKAENKVISALRLQAKNAGQTLEEFCKAKGIPIEALA